MSQDKINQLKAEYDSACHTGDEENAKAIEKELSLLGGRVVTRSREDEIQEFVEYMASFYSPEHPSCLYPYELPDGTPLTKSVIMNTTVYYTGWLPVIEQDFQGDSLDRERVRDILIAQGYSEVEK